MTAHFDIATTPLSRRGSWLSVSPVLAEHRPPTDLFLVSHRGGTNPVLALLPFGGTVAAGSSTDLTGIAADSSGLVWDSAAGRVELVFEGADSVRLRGEGTGIRLADGAEAGPWRGSYLYEDPMDGSAVFSSRESGHRYRVTVIAGSTQVRRAPFSGREQFVEVRGEGGWDILVTEFGGGGGELAPAASIGIARAAVADEFAAYLKRIVPVPRTATAEHAAYVLWSGTVAPAGLLKRETILMSKHWMDKAWSWDHCFNALALAPGDPEAALDQYLTLFDHQEVSGALPDVVGHSTLIFSFVKPPVHGWTLLQLLDGIEIEPALLERMYDQLSTLTRYWLDRRRVPGHALAHYQHGNDSGWDNSTLFDREPVLETPDLAALLVLQLDALEQIARRVRPAEAGSWAAEVRAMAQALLVELWTGERFIGRSAADGSASESRSLLTLVPIVAHRWLPGQVVDALVAGIEENLTEHGLATEPVDSPLYQNDGYWRGPIWAPPTVLIEQALRELGRRELADRIRDSFLALCEASGFAENFDAVTGEGLRDRAYTWTASCYLLLGRSTQAAGAGTR